MTTRTKLFIAVVVLQVGILISIPADQYIARIWGHTVELRVSPVDPFTPLSGYYVELNLDISRLMGFDSASTDLSDGSPIYTVIVPANDGAYDALRMSSTPPELSANERLIVGKMDRGRVIYGIEQRFIPEERRDEIEGGLRNAALDRRIQVRIDKNGNAALHRLRIGTTYY